MSLFGGRYRTGSTRLPGWNYAAPAWYSPHRGVSTASVDRPATVETPHRGVTAASDSPHSPPRLHPGSLGAIIGQFKSTCTKRIHRQGFTEFAWQARFHDRIVRDQQALYDIRRYIAENPLQGDREKLYQRAPARS